MLEITSTPDVYVSNVSEDRRPYFSKLRNIFRDCLPEGFEETMSYGMIGFVVPHSIYAAGYHVDPSLPLPFINLANKKNNIAIYHMGLYTDPEMFRWFEAAYADVVSTKLDMGKSCIRFKNPSVIPWNLISELASKMTPHDWIQRYELQRLNHTRRGK